MAKHSTTKARAPRTTKAQAKAPTAKRAVRKAAAVEADDEEGEDEGPRSVVKGVYKARYAAKGDPRNCGDWLAATLKEHVLDDDGHLDVSALERIAKANGVDPTYTNRSRGWEGRMRMTIGLKLRPVVAEQGGLAIPKGRGKTTIPAPKAFVDKHGH